MKIMVTGTAGQLGHDTAIELQKRGHEVICTDVLSENEVFKDNYFPLDITDGNAVLNFIEDTFPDAVIHCAAWTAVDAAEEPENFKKVFAVNVKGTQYIAESCKKVKAKMMYISTDYIFNGEGERPWQPDDTDYAPQNVYGESKLEGELAVKNTVDRYFIVRIAWVFGLCGKNFIKTMLNVGKKYDTVRVVNDQIGTPTYTKDLAILLSDMIVTDKYGIYHATNSETEPGGYISWYDFTKEIYKQANMSTNVVPVTTKEYGLSKAKRPYNSRLDKSKLEKCGFTPLPDWKDAVKRYLTEINYGTDNG